MYCKGLSKQDLMDFGIVSIYWDKHTNNWAIIRDWYKNNSKTKTTLYKLQICDVTTKHKYTGDKSYPKVQFNWKNRSYAFPLSRVIYAWFKGDIPDGYVIDHKNNDPYDNTLDNLQMLTIEQNIRKRYDDLDCKCFNQYHNTGF